MGREFLSIAIYVVVPLLFVPISSRSAIGILNYSILNFFFFLSSKISASGSITSGVSFSTFILGIFTLIFIIILYVMASSCNWRRYFVYYDNILPSLFQCDLQRCHKLHGTIHSDNFHHCFCLEHFCCIGTNFYKPETNWSNHVPHRHRIDCNYYCMMLLLFLRWHIEFSSTFFAFHIAITFLYF